MSTTKKVEKIYSILSPRLRSWSVDQLYVLGEIKSDFASETASMLTIFIILRIRPSKWRERERERWRDGESWKSAKCRFW